MFIKQLTPNEIKTVRNFIGLSTRKLGKKAGISHVTLYNIEHGVTKVSDRTNIRLLNVFVEVYGMTLADMDKVIELRQKVEKVV